MTPIPAQLALLRKLQSRLLKANVRSMANGELSQQEANQDAQTMADLIATLERQQMLAEVSEEMKAKGNL